MKLLYKAFILTFIGYLTQRAQTHTFRHTDDNVLLPLANLAIFSNSDIVTFDQHWKFHPLQKTHK